MQGNTHLSIKNISVHVLQGSAAILTIKMTSIKKQMNLKIRKIKKKYNLGYQILAKIDYLSLVSHFCSIRYFATEFKEA